MRGQLRPARRPRHWIIDGPTEQFVASIVYNQKLDLLFLTAGFPELHMMAIRPDGSGNVTDTHIAWRTKKGASYVPSPVGGGQLLPRGERWRRGELLRRAKRRAAVDGTHRHALFEFARGLSKGSSTLRPTKGTPR